MLERWILKSWYGQFKWTYVFWPLMLLYRYIVTKKRRDFIKTRSQSQSQIPVVIVGNITVGGTGKTPIVQSLVRFLQLNGYKPGIITRGYGGDLKAFPHEIKPTDTSSLVGDEPYMLSHTLNVPVVVDPKRINALNAISKMNVDVVISDDGMQHYELPRDIELCVLDGERGLGNEYMLPVGPLREPIDRLDAVDFILKSGKELTQGAFVIAPVAWVNVKSGMRVSLESFTPPSPCTAIAGIGNPDKFFNTLNDLGVQCKAVAFPDHCAYSEEDFRNLSGCILMTEKDAVKIKPFASEDMWFLEVTAKLTDSFFHEFMKKLNSIKFEKSRRDLNG